MKSLKLCIIGLVKNLRIPKKEAELLLLPIKNREQAAFMTLSGLLTNKNKGQHTKGKRKMTATFMEISKLQMISTNTTQGTIKKMPKTFGKVEIQVLGNSNRGKSMKIFIGIGEQIINNSRPINRKMETPPKNKKVTVVVLKKRKISSEDILRVICMISRRMIRKPDGVEVRLPVILKTQRISILTPISINLSLPRKNPKSRKSIKNTSQKMIQISTQIIEGLMHAQIISSKIQQNLAK